MLTLYAKRWASVGYDDWYIVSSIDDDTWVISEPHHPECSHFYLLRGINPDGTFDNVLIDTGLGFFSIKPLVESLTSGPVRVLLTHTHWDHIGGLRDYPDFAVHEAERDLRHPPLPLSKRALRMVATEENAELPEGFDLDAYEAYIAEPKRVLHDGDRVKVGNRTLEVIHTPGHSPGGVCYFEPERGYLFSGDLIYGACLYAQFHTCDLGQYEESMHRIAALEGVTRILPGHDSMDIGVDLSEQIVAAFDDLKSKGLFKKGTGRHDYDGFSINLGSPAEKALFAVAGCFDSLLP